MDDEPHPVVKVIAALTALASSVAASVVTLVAFRGGTVPFVGWQMDGGAVAGMFAMTVGFPMITMLGYWVGLLVGLPLQWLLTRRRNRR
ncbi:MAG: hypothetical protein RI958_141 [Actinomycetota bacterium]